MVKFSQFIRSFDKFGEAPKLLYKGEDKYKTKLGGVISIFITVFVLTFAYGKLDNLVNKKDPDVQN